MFELKKIGMVRRGSAWLLDFILLAVLATGFMFVISLICNYEGAENLSAQYYAEWEDFRKEYAGDVASYYGFTYEESENGYTITKDGAPSSLGEMMKKLDESKGGDEQTAKAYEAYLKLPPVAKVNAQYQYVYSLLLMMISLGLLFSYLILEFAVPLFLKNGQTVGKKVFGIGIVRPDCVKITALALFARTLLGKFSVETMFPIVLVYMFFFGGMGLTAIIVFVALVLFNTILFFATRNHTPIHDLFAGTVAVDIKLQMIFQTEEEMMEKKTLQHQEDVQKAEDRYR